MPYMGSPSLLQKNSIDKSLVLLPVVVSASSVSRRIAPPLSNGSLGHTIRLVVRGPRNMNRTSHLGVSSGHFTPVIHLRIGPVTLVSAVSGDITSEMWL